MQNAWRIRTNQQSSAGPVQHYSSQDTGDITLDNSTAIPAVPSNSCHEVHEFSFIPEEEYDSVMKHELTIESNTTSEKSKYLQGYRIVDLVYVLDWALSLQLQHSKICTVGNLKVIKEAHQGLSSIITFECDMCNKRIDKCTEDPKPSKSSLNYGAVWGTLSSGTTYSHLKELLGIMDIPCMLYRLFHKIEIELGECWKDNIWKSMEGAGKQEKQLTISAGQLDSDGVLWITVYVDGGWSHRSYGHSYNASSGVAVIIRKATGKLLFLGVRNKYCSVCTRYANKQKPVTPHTCYKNWSGSSSAMEASIVIEGFKNSQEMHGLKYLQFIADENSSVYAKIKSDVPYGIYVTKIECRNHAVKTMEKHCTKLK